MPARIIGNNNAPVFTDLDPNLTKSVKTNDVLSSKDDSAVRISIRNLLSTAYGERLFQPTVGCAIKNLLFEPIDAITTLELKDRILQTIRNHEPRVSNILVDVVAMPDQNEYEVTIEYSIVAVGKTDRISVTLERIR